MTSQDPRLNTVISYTIETAIRLGFLILLVLSCFNFLSPFVPIILWGLILSMASAPLFNRLSVRLGNRPKTAAGVLVTACLLLIILPSWLIFDSLFLGVQKLRPYLNEESLEIPGPSAQVAEWPLIGERLYAAWLEASVNMGHFVSEHQDQAIGIAKSITSGIAGIGESLLVFILAMILAGVILSQSDSENLGRKFFRRLVGGRGDELAETVAGTVRSVVKGVFGVAIIQSILIGIGMVLAGVPYAGLWTLLVLMMAILQLPVILVIIGLVFWLFSSFGTVGAVLWTIYFIAAGLSDNLLKPILLGKGSKVPMLVVFFGVIGGFIASGFIGLFTGAIITSIGYILFMSWLRAETPPKETNAVSANTPPIP